VTNMPIVLTRQEVSNVSVTRATLETDSIVMASNINLDSTTTIA
jgi:hypothetical protein